MKGHLKQRSPGRWAIIFDALEPDPETGKRRRVWHTFRGNKREAEQERARLATLRANGGYTEPTKVTVAQYLERWLEHEAANVSPKTLERYSEIVRKNLVPAIGAVTLAKLRAEAIDAAWSKALISGRVDGKGGLSPRTVGHLRRVLVMALNQAVRWEIISKNPAALTDAPKVERKPMKAYGPEATGTLLEAARGTRSFVLILLAVTCGLRRGEIVALQWKNVDLDGRRLAVAASFEQTRAGVRLKETKTGRARVVDLSATVAAELRRHRAAQAEEQLQLGLRLGADSFVVARADGEPIKPQTVTDHWDRAIRNAGLERIRFHDLRHSHATQMLAAGVHPKIASERLGHSTVGITLDLYSHIMPGMGAQAAEQVDAAIQRTIKAKADIVR